MQQKPREYFFIGILTRKTGEAGDPSLRLKNGYAQDDAR
jgi:hypothetical protein